MSTIVKVKDATCADAVRTTVSVPVDHKRLTRRACNEREELEIRAAINCFYTPMSEIHDL